MALTVAASASAGDLGGGTATTAPVDTTGASFVIVFVTATTPPAVSDSAGNVFSALTLHTNVGQRYQFYYVSAPLTSAAYTVTATGTGVSVCVIAFKGKAINSFTLDTLNVASGTSVSRLVSPAFDNLLLITGFASPPANTSTPTVDAGWAKVNGIAGDLTRSNAAIGYVLQGPMADINVTWSWTGSFTGIVEVVAFRTFPRHAAAGGGGNWLPLGLSL